jgi:hypothetical protein
MDGTAEKYGIASEYLARVGQKEDCRNEDVIVSTQLEALKLVRDLDSAFRSTSTNENEYTKPSFGQMG